MKLSAICQNIALDKLGAVGSLVQCMVKTEFEEAYYGFVGKVYEVSGVSGSGLMIKGLGPAIPERFRLISEGQ